MKAITRMAAAAACLFYTHISFAGPIASIETQFFGLSLKETIRLGSGAIPPDMAGGVSRNHVVQAVNGGVAIFDRNGTRLKTQTQSQFWQAAGIPASQITEQPFDPRLIYDPATKRFFAVAETGGNNNRIFVGVSNTGNPLDGFKAVSFVAGAPGYFADFPTLGVDGDALTIATNNFGAAGFTGVSVFTVPKADLLGPAPSLGSMSRFDNLDPATFGFSLQAVNGAPSDGRHPIFAISADNWNQVDQSSLNFSGSDAALSHDQIIGIAFDGAPRPSRQPEPVVPPLDAGDDRISSSVVQAGDFIYAVHTVGDTTSPEATTHNSVHWLIFDAATNGLVAEGLVEDPDMDFIYPSIAATADGRFVIAHNGSGPDARIGAYASVCTFNLSSAAACEDPLLLMAGFDEGYVLTGGGGRNRWGDYSAIQVDPNDINAFWLFLEIPDTPRRLSDGSFADSWTTVITELRVSVPEPSALGLACMGLIGLACIRRRK